MPSIQTFPNQVFTDVMSPDPMPLTNVPPMPLPTFRTPPTTVRERDRADGRGRPSTFQNPPAGAQSVFTRLSAFIRTFVRSKEPAAVAG